MSKLRIFMLDCILTPVHILSWLLDQWEQFKERGIK